MKLLHILLNILYFFSIKVESQKRMMDLLQLLSKQDVFHFQVSMIIVTIKSSQLYKETLNVCMYMDYSRLLAIVFKIQIVGFHI